MADGPAGPLPLPEGTRVERASIKGLSLVTLSPVPKGAVLEFELLLGARPMKVMARVAGVKTASPSKTEVAAEFLAMSQQDRDMLADFLQAVGEASLGVRPRRAD
jgi:hypothetical protein